MVPCPKPDQLPLQRPDRRPLRLDRHSNNRKHRLGCQAKPALCLGQYAVNVDRGERRIARDRKSRRRLAGLHVDYRRRANVHGDAERPVGSDTFTEITYASTNATGAPLSQSDTAATIVAGKANIVSITLDGIVVLIALSLGNTTPAQGTAATIPLYVTFDDASGAAIIGDDPFVNPITLTDSDSGAHSRFQDRIEFAGRRSRSDRCLHRRSHRTGRFRRFLDRRPGGRDHFCDVYAATRGEGCVRRLAELRL